ncbi:chorismate-binding protein [Candidatus Vidania fulgoroideae]|nr:chorismate-binding protein [Candidatus Vidania fulgoroideae]
MILNIRANGFYISFAISDQFEFYMFCLRELFFSSLFSLFVINSCYSYCINVTYSVIAICCCLFTSVLSLSYITVFNYHYFDFSCVTGNSHRLVLSPFLLVLYNSRCIHIYLFASVSIKIKLFILKLVYFLECYCVLYVRFFYLLIPNNFKLLYISNFYNVKANIATGNLIQCQLSKFNYLKSNIELSLLFLLCSTYDLCFSFVVISLRSAIISFTPELACVLNSSYIYLYPIAGTIYRGSDLFADKFFSLALVTNAKELSEHLMLVDLSRNDLNRFVVTYNYSFVFKIISFYYVHHIVSCLIARYWRSYTYNAVVCYISPIGTLSGAPKLTALRFISQYELPRGLYAGTICVRNLGNQLVVYFALIRSMVICGYYCLIRSASGIVLDSFIKNEYFELNNKLRVFLKR